MTPAGRVPDTKIVSLDTAAQTITLSRTPDTALPGRYGLFTEGTASYVKLGSVLAQDGDTVKRKLLTHIGVGASISSDAAFSGWYYAGPEELQLPFTPELIGSAVGPCPAWLFPAGDPSDLWVIQVHGRGTTRSECLRAVPVFHALGITTLVASYRNDGEAPRSRTGTYATRCDGVARHRRRRGVRPPPGGTTGHPHGLVHGRCHRAAGRAELGPSRRPGRTDPRVARHRLARGAGPSGAAARASARWSPAWPSAHCGRSGRRPVIRTGAAIPFDRLDVVARAAELRHPILILHSDDDGFVPSDASHDLVVGAPGPRRDAGLRRRAAHEAVELRPGRAGSTSIGSWLERQGITAVPADAGS